jgi:prepilin-type N-terminal cleavage/methylation domain-containing protein
MRKAGQFIREGGFTIVELMIALSILSVLLITTTIVLIQIGALYSKGVNAANLQNTTRTVVADLSAQLQFSEKVPNGCTPITTTCYAQTHPYPNAADGTTETVYSYCIGNTRYSYTLDRELGGDSHTTPQQVTPHVLWRDTVATDASTCPTMDITQADPESGICFDEDGSTGCLTQPGSGYEMLGNHMRLLRFNTQQTSGTNGIYGVEVWTAFGDKDLIGADGAGRPICNGGVGTQFCSTATITTQLTGRVY